MNELLSYPGSRILSSRHDFPPCEFPFYSFSPDESKITVIDVPGPLHIWDLQLNRLLLSIQDKQFTAAVFSHSGSKVYACSDDDIFVVDILKNSVVESIPWPESFPHDFPPRLWLSPLSEELWVAGQNKIWIADLGTGRTSHSFQFTDNSIPNLLHIAQLGGSVLLYYTQGADDGSRFRVYNTARQADQLVLPFSLPEQVHISPNGRRAVLNRDQNDNIFEVWDITTGERVSKLSAQVRSRWLIAPDGEAGFSCTRQVNHNTDTHHSVRTWDLTRGTLINECNHSCLSYYLYRIGTQLIGFQDALSNADLSMRLLLVDTEFQQVFGHTDGHNLDQQFFCSSPTGQWIFSLFPSSYRRGDDSIGLPATACVTRIEI